MIDRVHLHKSREMYNLIGPYLSDYQLEVLRILMLIAGISIFNWSFIGALLLIVLFMGSSTMAEKISASKYPEYSSYCEKVNKFFPGKRYSA